jgi:hypothetical protein
LPPVPVFRPTARVTVADQAGRVLLFGGTAGDNATVRTWLTPGGGVRARESLEQAGCQGTGRGDRSRSRPGHEAFERAFLEAHRWWTPAELGQTHDRVLPAGLPGLLRLLAKGLPGRPVRLPWVAFTTQPR